VLPDDPILQEIVNRLTADLPVSRIILFGSRCSGAIRADSDYDLAVVWDTPLDWLSRAVEVQKRLRWLPASVDALVFTSDEFEREDGAWPGVWRDIKRRGQLLFDRDALAA